MFSWKRHHVSKFNHQVVYWNTILSKPIVSWPNPSSPFVALLSTTCLLAVQHLWGCVINIFFKPLGQRWGLPCTKSAKVVERNLFHAEFWLLWRQNFFKNFENLSCLKPPSTELWSLISSLLWWISSTIIQIMSLGSL